jgi:hypothetical protein
LKPENLSLPLFSHLTAQVKQSDRAIPEDFPPPSMHASTRLPPLEAARQSSGLGLHTQQQQAKKVRCCDWECRRNVFRAHRTFACGSGEGAVLVKRALHYHSIP